MKVRVLGPSKTEKELYEMLKQVIASYFDLVTRKHQLSMIYNKVLTNKLYYIEKLRKSRIDSLAENATGSISLLEILPEKERLVVLTTLEGLLETLELARQGVSRFIEHQANRIARIKELRLSDVVSARWLAKGSDARDLPIGLALEPNIYGLLDTAETWPGEEFSSKLLASVLIAMLYSAQIYLELWPMIDAIIRFPSGGSASGRASYTYAVSYDEDRAELWLALRPRTSSEFRGLYSTHSVQSARRSPNEENRRSISIESYTLHELHEVVLPKRFLDQLAASLAGSRRSSLKLSLSAARASMINGRLEVRIPLGSRSDAFAAEESGTLRVSTSELENLRKRLMRLLLLLLQDRIRARIAELRVFWSPCIDVRSFATRVLEGAVAGQSLLESQIENLRKLFSRDALKARLRSILGSITRGSVDPTRVGPNVRNSEPLNVLRRKLELTLSSETETSVSGFEIYLELERAALWTLILEDRFTGSVLLNLAYRDTQGIYALSYHAIEHYNIFLR